jgi:hypothetical protein
MSQLNKWMLGGKISKLVVVVTDKETGEHVERWQFDVRQPLNGFAQRLIRIRFLSGPNIRKAYQEPNFSKIC